jgi:hypothetical protein
MVVAVLHSPREKCWGRLEEISPAGIFLRGVDLNAFDDLVRAIAHDEPFAGLTAVFFPLWRVERITLDERAGDLPSLAELFEARTGRPLLEFLQT